MIEPHIIGKMGQRAAEAQVTKLFAEQEIAIRVEELARYLSQILRALHRLGGNPGVEFIRLSSYGLGRESSGTPRLIGETELDLAGRAVLLVDDIVDTGRTLLYARDLLRRKKAATVLTCALVDKPSRREVAVNPDFVGFTVPDAFIVGYGIDHAHQFRQLPFIGMIK